MRLKSKVGWIFVAAYLGFATCFYYKAFTDKSFHGGLAGFWPSIPFGIIYLYALEGLNNIYYFNGAGFDGSSYPPIISMPFNQWLFVIPTIVGNAVIYYWLGAGISKGFRRFFSKRSEREGVRHRTKQ